MFSKKFVLLQSNECAFCSKDANYVCDRCGETYCSLVCQVNDWREHRRYCLPLP